MSRSLLLASVPILVLGTVSVLSLLLLARNAQGKLEESKEELTTETAGQSRHRDARAMLRATDQFLAERVDDVIDWSRTTSVLASATADYEELAPYQGLAPEEVPGAELEAQYGVAHQLDPDNGVGVLRSQLIGQPIYSEVLFTDVNGLTVSSAPGTPDAFYHRDQTWWQEAWASGAYIGPVEASNANGQLQFEIAIRMAESGTGTVRGVMRAVVNATILQTLAEEQALDTGQVDVQLFSANGALLADTVSDNDPSRIGSTFVIDEISRAALDQLGDESSEGGFVVVNNTVAGYAESSPTVTADGVAFEVPGPQWVAVVRQPMSIALAPLAGVDQIGTDLNTTVWAQGLLVLGLVAVTLVLAWLGSRRLAVRISRPINQLRDEAIRVADHELPELVSALAAGYELEDLDPLQPIDVRAEGEVAELAAALSSLQTTASDLAAGQAIGRTRDVAAVLLNLGRRNQQLIGRQLRYIDQLERNESDPDTLKNLFLLDQMATRMRRNAESLLVLAGEDPPRRGTQPRPPEEILRAAISEVEDYARVAISVAEPARIRPHVVSDLTHLLAELIENATNFSAPETTIHVSGQREPDGCYTVSVVDRGIGMSPDRLSQANQRISDPTFTSDASSTFLGLYVVGRLAARHAIQVRLVESGTAGIAAIVTLPHDCLVAESGPIGWDTPGGESSATAPSPVYQTTGNPGLPDAATGQHPAVRPPSLLPPSVSPPAPVPASAGSDQPAPSLLAPAGPPPVAATAGPGRIDDAGPIEPAAPLDPSSPIPMAAAAENPLSGLLSGRKADEVSPQGPAGDAPFPGGLGAFTYNEQNGSEQGPTDTDGVPIPPFRARQSTRDEAPGSGNGDTNGGGAATFQVKRRVPGQSLSEIGLQGTGLPNQPDEAPTPTPLNPDGSLTETSMNRAAEVRDKLTRFTIGVGAAKAEKTKNDEGRPSAEDARHGGGNPSTGTDNPEGNRL